MATMPEQPNPPGGGLVRALGLVDCSALVVGTLIGTGVFFVAQDMVRAVHSFLWVLLAWVVGGFLSLTGAMAYAELGSLFPQSGGEYVYLRHGLGRYAGFLFGWGMFWIIRPASAATIAAGFSLAAGFLLPALKHSLLGGFTGEQGVAALAIALLTGINYFGVRQGGRVQTLFTILKLALLLGLAIAAFALGHGQWRHLAQSLAAGGAHGGIRGGAPSLLGFSAALVSALWAYDGWNNLTLAGEEIRNPQRNIPRALLYGIGLVFLFYLMINLAYFYVLGPAGIAAHRNVAGAMARVFAGAHAGALVEAAILISAFATLNSSILSGARVPFAMARDGLFFKPLARVHSRYRTPHVALLLQAVFCIALALLGTYHILYTMTIFGEWLFYTLAVVALFGLRRRGVRGPFRAWGFPLVPAVFVLLATLMLGLTFSQHVFYSALGLLVILSGTPAYFWWRRKAAAV